MNYKTLIIMLLVIGMIFSSVNAQIIATAEKLEPNQTKHAISTGFSFDLNVQEENRSGEIQDNTNSEGNTRLSSSVISTKPIDVKETDKKRIINAFQIKETSAFKQETITKLLNVESRDKDNFQEITSITLKYVKNDIDKEIFVKEMLVMDKKFIEEISSSNNDEEISLKNQINEFINNINLNKTIKIEIKDTQIEDLLNKKFDIKNFIEQIW